MVKLLLLWLLGVPLVVGGMVLARGLTADSPRAQIYSPAQVVCLRQANQNDVVRAIAKQRYWVGCRDAIK